MARHRLNKQKTILFGTSIFALSLALTFGIMSANNNHGTVTIQKEAHHPRMKREDPPSQDVNLNCSITVPHNPLTATGLATPYLLGNGCHETTPVQAAFVEATIVDPAGHLSVYHPLVIDATTQPAVAPVVPTIAAGSTVGIWFGFNGNTLTLTGDSHNCVNGLGASKFGQFAYCNAPAFFAAARQTHVVIPPLGTDRQGMTCPSVRDYSVVDQDQSDNVDATYVIVNGQLAQDNAANRALPGAAVLANGSDNRLLNHFIQPALGCAPMTAPDLSNGGIAAPSLALNELQATQQGAPVALVPLNDPMTKVGNATVARKTNLYRAGVNQPPLPAGDTLAAYCHNMVTTATTRIMSENMLYSVSPSPDGDAVNLADFLMQRLAGSIQVLGCPA